MCLTFFYIALENIIIMKNPFVNILFTLSNRIKIINIEVRLVNMHTNMK